MAGILDGIVRGIASLAPQDDPDVKIFNAQTELKDITEKEEKIYAALGRRVFAENGKEAYPETAVQLEALSANRAEIEAKVAQMKAEKEAREKAEAEAQAQREAAEADRTCPSCGTVNAEGCKFCCDCGTRLPEKAEAKKRFCTECGAEVADGMKFCSGCGARQGE